MHRTVAAIAVLAALGTAAPQPLQARPMAIINYQRQFDQSDLVVIATPTAKTADTSERSLILNIYRQDRDGKQIPVESVGVETPCRIAAVLKGDKALKQFTLHHYREEADGALATVNGPLLVSFADPSDGKNLHSYLMFLVREADGRYAPTGGQTDPAYHAIHALPYEPPPH
jgi:hypothetical protein